MLALELGQPTRVDLAVYDLQGRLVTRLLEETLAAGRHTIRWQAEGLPAGLYLLHARAAGQTPVTRKALLLR